MCIFADSPILAKYLLADSKRWIVKLFALYDLIFICASYRADPLWIYIDKNGYVRQSFMIMVDLMP